MFSKKEVGLLVIAENTCLRHDVLAQHGVSFRISYYGKKYLFDCGQIFIGLEHNMNQFRLDGEKLEAVIISHDHHDHCNALPEFTQKFNPKKIYVPKDFSSFKSSQIIKVNDVIEIEKGLFLTGPLNGWKVQEQSLVIDLGDRGIVVITGCSHPGLMTTISKAQEITGNKKIMGVIGGLHLVESSDDDINNLIDYLKGLDLGFLIPGHCTGINAVNLMKEQLGDKVKTSLMGSIGVGNHICFAPKLKISLDEPKTSKIRKLIGI